MVKSLHEVLVRLPKVCTLSVPSVITSVYTSATLSVNPSDVECQEILEEFPGTNSGEIIPVEITTLLPVIFLMS